MPSITSTWGDSQQRSEFFEKLRALVALNEIRIMSIPSLKGLDLPLATLTLLVAGGALLISAHYLEYPPLGGVGSVALLSTLAAYPLELIYKRFLIGRRLKEIRPLLDEIYDLRMTLNGYLCELDKRTSRYFHCVTNTKVTTYFVLRQIEFALAELSGTIERLKSKPSASNFATIANILRGDLQYRDGFEFSQGEVHRTPVAKISQYVLQLASELEQGLAELEEEIEHYNEQVAPFQEKGE